jgi:hypothetical protein
MFSKAFASAQHTIGGRGWNGPSWPLLEMFEDATRKDVKIIHNFLDPILQSATSQHSGDPNQSTFLNHLVSETEDPALLRDELLNILVAGNVWRPLWLKNTLTLRFATARDTVSFTPLKKFPIQVLFSRHR